MRKPSVVVSDEISLGMVPFRCFRNTSFCGKGDGDYANYCGLKHSNPVALFALAFVLFAMAGCGTLSNGRGWGQDAIYPVELKRIPRAALNALIDPQTFIPAAGALAFGLSKWDKKVSHWATTIHLFSGLPAMRHMTPCT